MLIAQKLLKFVNIQFKLNSFLSTNVFRLQLNSPKSPQIFYFCKRRDENLYIAKICLGILYCLMTWCQILVQGFQGSLTVSGLVTSLLYVATVPVHLVVAWAHFKKRDEIVGLFNALIDFEKRHNGNYIKHIYFEAI